MTSFYLSQIDSRVGNRNFYPEKYPLIYTTGIVSSLKKHERDGCYEFTMEGKPGRFYGFSTHNAYFEYQHKYIKACALTKTPIEFDAFQVNVTNPLVDGPIYGCCNIRVKDIDYSKISMNGIPVFD